MRDHGGDLDRARALHGPGDWLDLSTGINAVPYPVGPLPPEAWAALPPREAIAQLEAAARTAYGAGQGTPCVALAGAQAAIQLVPRLARPGAARVVTPTYNEHAGALEAQGWRVTPVATPDALRGAALGVVVNPNNPDGRCWSPETLLAVAGEVGLLVVDESFADTAPGLSLIPRLHARGGDGRIVVLRSFGKFFGLAGLRLGFALGDADAIERLRALAGPWAVSGPAAALGTEALGDTDWQAATRARLGQDAQRLDEIAARAGWPLVGGTALFRTYDAGDGPAAQARLAAAHIWSRVFPYSTGWIRLGVPGDAAGWRRLERALAP